MGRDTARLRSLQRLDLADIENLQNFVTDYMSLALGGLFGYTRGLLTPPEVRVSGENGGRAFNLTAFQVAISEQGDSHSHNDGGARSDVKLQVVRFDPRDSNHLLNGAAITNGLIEYQSTDLNKFLCVKTVAVNEDSQNRVFWSVASNAESAQSTATTTRTRLEFNWRTALELQGSDAQESEYNNEAPILILTDASSGADQRVKLISAWDDYKTYQFLQESDANNWYDDNNLIGVSPLLDEELRPSSTTVAEEGLDGVYSPDALDYTRDLGLNMLLALYRSRMRRVISDGSADVSDLEASWAERPSFSLNGLNEKLDNHIAREHTLRFQSFVVISKTNGTVSITLASTVGNNNPNTNIDSLSFSLEHASVNSEYIAQVTLTKDSNVSNINNKNAVVHYEPVMNGSGFFVQNNTLMKPLDLGIECYSRLTYFPAQGTIDDVFSADDFRFAIRSSVEPHLFHDGNGAGNGTSFILKVSIYGTITS